MKGNSSPGVAKPSKTNVFKRVNASPDSRKKGLSVELGAGHGSQNLCQAIHLKVNGPWLAPREIKNQNAFALPSLSAS